MSLNMYMESTWKMVEKNSFLLSKVVSMVKTSIFISYDSTFHRICTECLYTTDFNMILL